MDFSESLFVFTKSELLCWIIYHVLSSLHECLVINCVLVNVHHKSHGTKGLHGPYSTLHPHILIYLMN